jgi:hypothetical protein
VTARFEPLALGAARATAMFALAASLAAAPARAQAPPVLPPEKLSNIASERRGFHDAANIRTLYYNFGMVGDFPQDAINVDLSVFHSVEVPRGSGMNYSDGITPFVLTNLDVPGGPPGAKFHIMETGFRERQAISPFTNRQMRFEPRPGYFDSTSTRNTSLAPAISSDSTTWPPRWPDRELDGAYPDPDDPGWAHSWDGYFGKRLVADQESFSVMDDNKYDAYPTYNADPRSPATPADPTGGRRGLGLRVEVRGFQWANPQAGNVIFWHYDITNETPTEYNDNIIFGLYMDSGVGGSAVSCDGVAESDDDNAYWDKTFTLNLVYTWDKSGHGRDLSGPCGKTGYLGYAYLETPGNSTNGLDDDRDGIKDESRDGGPEHEVTGPTLAEAQATIMDSVAARCDTTLFQLAYGRITDRPAYRAGVWWTGDEDMDWRADLDDVGADGVRDTHDAGEGDGIPTEGEPDFDRTDLNESDQIGLTGFKMNRIRAGVGNPDQTIDDILFYSNSQTDWPDSLWRKFTASIPTDRFDQALAANYNIGFFFASGPFLLGAGKRERFSLSLAYGSDLAELRETAQTVQLIYNANYQFAVPPPLPTVTAEAGDGFVRLTWDDVAERGIDPVTGLYDFEGYRIYRSTDPEFRDPRVLTTGRGDPFPSNGKPIAQFDLLDGKRGYSKKTIAGVAYWLGNETNIVHTWTDATVTNGQEYFYAVCSYDFGYEAAADSAVIYPSESPITITRTARGTVHYPGNVAHVRPNPRVQGWEPAATNNLTHVAGNGTGHVAIEVVNADSVPSDHVYKIKFAAPAAESILATTYSLIDSTTGTTLFSTGTDFDSLGVGPVGAGLLLRLNTRKNVTVDSLNSKFRKPAPPETLFASYQTTDRSINMRRIGFPDDLSIVFDSTYRDTSIATIGFPLARVKFRVFSHTAQGDVQMDFRFKDTNSNGTLDKPGEEIDVYCPLVPGLHTTTDITWRVEFVSSRSGFVPGIRDTFDLVVRRPLGAQDVFVFHSVGAHVNASAQVFQEKPYVVPNPYVGSASFEPRRFAESGRGTRRIEFRALPQGAVIRIYTVHGDLVRTLRQGPDSGLDINAGYVPWDIRTRDNLEAAPGLYLFQVEAPGYPGFVGKFAIVK